MQQLQPNTLLQGGKYKIIKVLGQGGFGITYLAEQVSLGRKVAIKEFFYKDLCIRDDNTTLVYTATAENNANVQYFKQKFIREAKNIAGLHHTNIVNVLENFEENGTAYYVMEYLSGGSLADLGKIDEETAVSYIRQIADALSYMHGNMMCHFDVKPANIMLNEKGEAVLIDFGISRQYKGDGGADTVALACVSEGYSPLELYSQNRANRFSPQSDVYSLGATLYKLLSGKRPPNASEIVQHGLPKSKYIDSNLMAVIEKAMRPVITERYQSMSSFESGLCSDFTDLPNGPNPMDKFPELHLRPSSLIPDSWNYPIWKRILMLFPCLLLFATIIFLPEAINLMIKLNIRDRFIFSKNKFDYYQDYFSCEMCKQSKPFIFIVKNGKFGVYNLKKGTIQIPTVYDTLKWREYKKLLTATKNGRKFIVDIYGNELL